MSTKLDRIGTAQKKHLEKQLSDYAEGLIHWFTITTVPQGLAVSPTISLQVKILTRFQLTSVRSSSIIPFRWKVQQRNGYNILKGVSSDDAELKHVLSADYNIIMSRLRGDVSQLAFEPSRLSPQPSESTRRTATGTAEDRADGQLDGPPAKKRKV